MTTFVGLPAQGSRYWKDAVDAVGDLPASALTGEARYVIAEGAIYVYDGSSWAVGSAGGSSNGYFPGGW